MESEKHDHAKMVHFDIQTMLEKVVFLNIAPSLSSGDHIFDKAKYMEQSCLNQASAITFD